MEELIRTNNQNLQTQLTQWEEQIKSAIQALKGPERLAILVNFCRGFVPSDVNEEDTLHYAQTLADDEVDF